MDGRNPGTFSADQMENNNMTLWELDDFVHLVRYQISCVYSKLQP